MPELASLFVSFSSEKLGAAKRTRKMVPRIDLGGKLFKIMKVEGYQDCNPLAILYKIDQEL